MGVQIFRYRAEKIRVWRTTVACFVHRTARFWRLLIDHRLVLTAFKDAPLKSVTHKAVYKSLYASFECL